MNHQTRLFFILFWRYMDFFGQLIKVFDFCTCWVWIFTLHVIVLKRKFTQDMLTPFHFTYRYLYWYLSSDSLILHGLNRSIFEISAYKPAHWNWMQLGLCCSKIDRKTATCPSRDRFPNPQELQFSVKLLQRNRPSFCENCRTACSLDYPLQRGHCIRCRWWFWCCKLQSMKSRQLLLYSRIIRDEYLIEML